MAQAIRAILLASATAATFVCRRSVGLVPSDQGHKQIEKGGTSCACPRADTRSKASYRNSRLAEKVILAERKRWFANKAG
jgi:hypothetical protein